MRSPNAIGPGRRRPAPRAIPVQRLFRALVLALIFSVSSGSRGAAGQSPARLAIEPVAVNPTGDLLDVGDFPLIRLQFHLSLDGQPYNQMADQITVELHEDGRRVGVDRDRILLTARRQPRDILLVVDPHEHPFPSDVLDKINSYLHFDIEDHLKVCATTLDQCWSVDDGRRLAEDMDGNSGTQLWQQQWEDSSQTDPNGTLLKLVLNYADTEAAHFSPSADTPRCIHDFLWPSNSSAHRPGLGLVVIVTDVLPTACGTQPYLPDTLLNKLAEVGWRVLYINWNGRPGDIGEMAGRLSLWGGKAYCQEGFSCTYTEIGKLIDPDFRVNYSVVFASALFRDDHAHTLTLKVSALPPGKTTTEQASLVLPLPLTEAAGQATTLNPALARWSWGLILILYTVVLAMTVLVKSRIKSNAD